MGAIIQSRKCEQTGCSGDVCDCCSMCYTIGSAIDLVVKCINNVLVGISLSICGKRRISMTTRSVWSQIDDFNCWSCCFCWGCGPPKVIRFAKSGKTSIYFIETKTDRILKITSKSLRNGEEIESTTTFSDYKQNKDGYWFAYGMTTSQGEISYSEIETNVAVDDAFFKVN